LAADVGELGPQELWVADLVEVRPVALGVGFTLHHFGLRLPAVVRVVADGHPLSGRALRARRAYRRYGRLWLVVELPDGGETSVEVSDTDVLGAAPAVTVRDGTTLSGEGARRLLGLLEACMARGAVDVAAGERSSR
jgi:hypothetical protein